MAYACFTPRRCTKGLLEIEYEYSSDPGVYTYSNGSPGYSPSESLSIKSITMQSDLRELLDNYETTDEILKEINSKILEFEEDE